MGAGSVVGTVAPQGAATADLRAPGHRPDPVTRMIVAQLVTASGDGAFFTCCAVYLTHQLGLSPSGAAGALSAGWAVGSVVGLLSGWLCDRRSAVAVAVAWCIAGAIFVLALAVPAPAVVTLAVCAGYSAGQCSLATARQTLVARLVGGAERARLSARLQVATNAGLAGGSVLGGLALASDSPGAYRAVLVVDAVSFLICAALLLQVRHRATTRPDGALRNRSPERRRPVGSSPPGPLRDLPYLAVAALNAVLLLRMPLLTVALPLWVAARTRAPLWAVSVAFALNTLVVLACQLPVTRTVTDVRSAGRAVRTGGALLALSCLAFAGTAATGPVLGAAPATVAVAVLLVGATVQVAGELLQSAGTWLLSFQLAPEHRHGGYQGLFAAGTALARAAGPLLLVDLLLDAGQVGWLLVGGAFLTAGGLTPVAARRAAARSPAP